MRAIRGAAPGASIAEMWAALRDDPGITPNYGDQVAAHAAAQDYTAPSKAHVKRLLRDRREAESCPPRNVVVASERELFMRAQTIALRDATRQETGKLSQMRWDASHSRFVEA